MKIGSLCLARRKWLGTRKVPSEWGGFLQCLTPNVLRSEEAKALRKSSRRGVAIDGSWVGETDIFQMSLLNVAQERFPWDHPGVVGIDSGRQN